MSTLKQAMQALTCIRCGKPATIGEHDDAIGSFLACSDECHAAELAERTSTYADESAGVYERKRERIAAIRAGQIQHPGYVGVDPGEPGGDRLVFSSVHIERSAQLRGVLERIEAAGALRLTSADPALQSSLSAPDDSPQAG